ncbi:MAG TPA: hypothetical protein VFV99_33225 [Kofleriaceae bacterium]|nr:hypothetical protein [Kofleriaceae bacterium]
MLLRAVLAAFVLAGCAADARSLDGWRGQYRVDSSSCAFVDGTTPVRLHDPEPGTLAIYAFMPPDADYRLDGVTLEADGNRGLTGSAVTLLCGPPCSSCTREVRYERDDVTTTSSTIPPTTIHLQLLRASEPATEGTCTEDRAWALAASAVPCMVDATYYAADHI